MKESILALNAGSSSLKFGLFESSADLRAMKTLARGTVRMGDRAGFHITAVGSRGEIILNEGWRTNTPDALIQGLLCWIELAFERAKVIAVGHRVVHGGVDFAEPVIVDKAVLARLDALTQLAPLHQPASLEPARIIATLRPDLVQVACFDTAFHRTIELPASRYALPRAYEADGIRRYGFHGLSYESIAAQLAEDGAFPSRVIVAHLGNGASLCAMRNLESVDTTMGFSTLDGLVMGTRPGSLDPGILLYLLKEKSLSPDRLEQLLYRESGLLGISGISSDVATLLASDVPAAKEALDLFAFQVARQTAALAATLGGVDRFIFTGGIGEHSPEVRKMIVTRLEWLGATLDEPANKAGMERISNKSSKVVVERRETHEEQMIARHVNAALNGTCGGPGTTAVI